MNPVVHFEMPYEDCDRMAKFYETVFGWKVQMLGSEMGDYVLVTTAESDVKSGAPAGAIDGGFYKKTNDGQVQHPSLTIGVDDINVSMEQVRKSGGTVFGKPHDIPGVGAFVYFQDTEGNVMGMLQPMPMN